MIRRNMEATLMDLAGYYPVVTVTGPRQSGKTTLCTYAFPDRPHVSLEPLDQREAAQSDPRGFLREYRNGAVIDEVQHVPGLLSYLQEEVDRDPTPGRFILTGSQHFGLVKEVAQSLAGRTAVLTLLPPSLDELERFSDDARDLFETMWTGAYPRIHDRGIPADRWLADYVTTYVQRDVRQLLNVTDLTAFSTFIGLCAGRTATPLNLTALGGDAGVSHNTARAWLSVLEASYICFRVPVWHRNIRKQMTKAHKLHFFDSGLLCHLLGIREPDQLRHHPLRGNVFETWVASEIYKARAHRGHDASLFHFRDARGLEVDLVVEAGDRVLLTETKSGATTAVDFFNPLDRVGEGARRLVETNRQVEQLLVYGGDASSRRGQTDVVPWSRVQERDWG